MPLSPAERQTLIDRYASGYQVLTAALAKVPKEAMQWRPGPKKWSAHEVIVHCADSESYAHVRLRILLGSQPPAIQGYDQARWAQVLDYHTLPVDTALKTVEAVRANTVPILRRMTDADWAIMGTHSEVGRYGTADWLKTYSEHLEKHAGQIERNLAAWRNR